MFKNIICIIALIVTFAVTAEAQKVLTARQLGIDSSKTIAMTGINPTADDTLALGGANFTIIKVRGIVAAVDSVGRITGGVTGRIYQMRAVADDTTITFVDGANLKLGAASRALDALTDQLWLYFDGTNFLEMFFVSND